MLNRLLIICFLAASALASRPLPAQSSGDGVIKPPAGMCRIWVDGVRPDKQPAPTDCASALKNKPTNGRVIFGDPKPVVAPSPASGSTGRPPTPPDTSKSKPPAKRGRGDTLAARLN